ncbi:trk system potassium uptake protein TrkH [Balnearium lithotrophicum]|uniref:Trk system potassium uptake protein TrkH n=1 Tax=Balnearium lithotrophicum TaxID=223788 RepID=A0A521BRH4_9BACT|nr:potassium transporter TrkG [Balnearium lithotrophicum]SMO49772.1 trk system potassium uptake protein TrkH [Balnearium lithotrophicum]
MRLSVVFKQVVTLLFFLSFSFLVPALYSFLYQDGLTEYFLFPLVFMGALYFLAFQIKIPKNDISVKEAILIVVLVWFLFPALSAMCYMETGAIKSFPDAYFESVSGFTTTGASILTNIEALPKSVLLWRSTTHWIGGLGFVVFSLSILPAIGAGGAQLIRFESSKAVEEKILPKVKEVAKAILIAYSFLTVAEVVLLKLAGMNLYEAVTHTFGTVATGGFSTKNASVGAFHSPLVETIIAVFMLLGASNLALYYRAFKKRSIRYFFSYPEVKSLFIIALIMTFFFTAVLYSEGYYSSLLQALRYAFFQVSTAISTTGFASTDYSNWPPVLLALIMILSLIGASSGSTAGGIKQFRFLVLGKTAYGELKKTVHPRLIYRVNLGGKPLEISTLNAIWAFVSIYFSLTVLFGLIISLSGYDLITSFSASIACITSLGPGLGKVGPAGNFAFFSSFDKLLLSVEMLLGRLEVFPILAVFIPYFWKD